jgi:hypothetical protein
VVTEDDTEERRTLGHQTVCLQSLFQVAEQRERRHVHGGILTRKVTDTGDVVEVVTQCDAESFGDFHDFVLAVAVECSPPDSGTRMRARCIRTPVERLEVLRMSDYKLTSFMLTRKAHHKRAELQRRPWSIHVRFEEARRSRIDLPTPLANSKFVVDAYI